MNINWLKVGKVGSIVLTLAGGVIGSVVNAKEIKRTTIETTEKLFKDYIKNK